MGVRKCINCGKNIIRLEIKPTSWGIMNMSLSKKSLFFLILIICQVQGVVATEPIDYFDWNYELDQIAWDVAMSADGSYIAVGSGDSYGEQMGNVILLNNNGEKLWNYKMEYAVWDVAISDDGSYVAAGVGWDNNNVYLFNLDGEKLWNYNISDKVNGIAMSSDGAYVAVGSGDWRNHPNGTIYLFNLNGEILWTYDTVHEVDDIAISADGSSIAAVMDSDIYLFNGDGKKLWNYDLYAINDDRSVQKISISADGSYVAAGGTNGNIYLLDHNGAELWNYNAKKDFWGNIKHEDIWGVSISTDGSFVAAGGNGGLVHFFNRNGKKLWTYNTPFFVHSVSTSPDGSFLAVGGNGVHLLNVNSIPATSDINDTNWLFIGVGAMIVLGGIVAVGKRRRMAPEVIQTSSQKSHKPAKRSALEPNFIPTKNYSPLEKAKSAIQDVEIDLQDAMNRGVNIQQSIQQLLQDARKEVDAGHFATAKEYAHKCSENINIAVKDYEQQKAEQARKQRELEQLRTDTAEKIKIAKNSLEKAKKLGVTVQSGEELNTKAQSAFDANDYNSAISYANKSRGTTEQLIDESKPSISIELPPKMEYKAWKHRDLIVTNKGTAHAVAITITFLTALEVRDFKIIKRLEAGKQKTINVNIKPTEKGEVPVDYVVEFKDILDRVYKTEDTAIIQISTDIETAGESVTSPSEKVMTDSNKFVVLRKDDFFNGFIRLKISVQNKMQLTATDVSLDIEHDENVLRFDHHEPNTYAMKKEKIQLGNIASNGDKTIVLYFEGLICSKGGVINCRIDYKDAYGKPDLVRMEPVKIPIVCPLFKTEQDINIGRLKELVASLPAQSSKEFLLPSGVSINKALTLCREVIQMHDVRHVRTFKTTDDKTYETWYYGKTKVKMIDLVIKASVSKETERIEIFVAAPDQEDIIGLFAELGRNFSKRGEALGKLAPVFNVSIKDSQIMRSNLLGACDINGICDGNVVIEDSWVRRSSIANNANNVSIHIKDSNVERSTIGAGTKKCPNCGIEVEDEQKFCLECGAKL
ncbi:MAG: PQQ-binding-like beta-propeller repeat protein [ANME-2 cluster archaeon]|nr:PQQ-binding-like beta-propeller repeat protein [ANME-2 cluster archaeon]MBC2701512.1 PQQ-binding-like beta-propeller repeat protein [ANME-2 cluster archaeon]MBC2706843.1 PQQ-binding-like beta-propeller repeat protein [ANME-2 cluster archaeon]MBC2746132.1 PQQ-binding-like beta-propeller repeat protein [ANME-2 cluster archaeon]MBC2762182.1 PQQ-binding-like beta-propeller repeat protein [ANME-2 cluster archaeon]